MTTIVRTAGFKKAQAEPSLEPGMDRGAPAQAPTTDNNKQPAAARPGKQPIINDQSKDVIKRLLDEGIKELSVTRKEDGSEEFRGKTHPTPAMVHEMPDRHERKEQLDRASAAPPKEPAQEPPQTAAASRVDIKVVLAKRWRHKGESVNDCVSRKIKLMHDEGEGLTHEQIVGKAEGMCRENGKGKKNKKRKSASTEVRVAVSSQWNRG